VRIFYRAVTLIVGIFLVLFAVSNRETVSLALWPLPFLIDLPIYLLFFFTLMIGILIGATMAWIAGRGDRRELRHRRRRIDALERELAATQSQLEDQAQMPTERLPAVSPPS
jgi:lipopolysaccharide assembly protein A